MLKRVRFDTGYAYGVGLSYAEAAEVCGCPVGTIPPRLGRAREDLGAVDGRSGRTARRGGHAAG